MYICMVAELFKMENKSFILEFIEVYRSLPALWNIKGKEYANRDHKNTQNETLLKKYREKYPEASQKEVGQNINTLRTNYRRELKRISGLERSGSGITEENEPTLFYFDALDFLRDNEKPCSSRSNIEVNENITDDFEAPRKRKKSDPSDELITLAAKRLSEPKNEFHAVADTWALKLKKLEETQRMFAEKFINDILFEAQMGGLHRNSMHLNITSRTSTPVPSASIYSTLENSVISSHNPMSDFSYDGTYAQNASSNNLSRRNFIISVPRVSSPNFNDLSWQSSSPQAHGISSENTSTQISDTAQYFATFK